MSQLSPDQLGHCMYHSQFEYDCIDCSDALDRARKLAPALSADQIEAIELGKRMLELRRVQDEYAAEQIAANNPPYVLPSRWTRLVRWARGWWEAFLGAM